MILATSTGPEWLYSTAAQSAAALVAIIGGLLVSRLVALSGERQAAARELERLERLLTLAEATRDQQNEEVRAKAKDAFRGGVVRAYVSYRGDPPADEADYPVLGADDDERQEWGAELAAQVKGALSVLDNEKVRLGGRLPPQDARRALAQAQVPSDVSGEVVRQRRSTAHGLLAGIDAESIVIPSAWERPERVGAIQLRDRLVAEADGLAARVDLEKAHLRRVATPRGVGWGILALLVFSVIGIALPLSLLAVQPAPSGPLPSVGVIVAFLIGLAGVLWFMFDLLKSLRLPKEVEGT